MHQKTQINLGKKPFQEQQNENLNGFRFVCNYVWPLNATMRRHGLNIVMEICILYTQSYLVCSNGLNGSC